MRSEVEKLKERVSIYIDGKDTRNQIVSVLTKVGLPYEDATEESGYPNIRVGAVDGYVRIYKGVGMKQFRVQQFNRVDLTYSGIPVFEPSGRRSM